MEKEHVEKKLLDTRNLADSTKKTACNGNCQTCCRAACKTSENSQNSEKAKKEK